MTRGVKTVCKVRGITLNYNAPQVMNFNTIKNLVLNKPANSTVRVHTSNNIKRKMGEGACVSIVTEHEDKIYRISFFKMRHRGDNCPFRSGINKKVP